MRISPKTLSISALCFLIGFLTMLVACIIIKRHRQRVEGEVAWLVCTRGNMDVIADAAAAYIRTNAARGPLNLETLVRAGLLPEWSNVYICPGRFDIRSSERVHDESSRSNLFSIPPIAAHYSRSPYYLEILPGSVRIRCIFHTNELNYTVRTK